MQSVLLGAGAGVAVGFLIGFVLAKGGVKKVAAECEVRVKEARDKLESAKKEAAAHMEKERSRAVDAEKRLADVGEKNAALEKSLEHQKGQAKQLQSSIAEAEAQRVKLSTQAEANDNARQQAEGRLKQSETVAAQAQQALAGAQSQLQTAQSELAGQKEAADRHHRELQKLRGELTALKQAASAGSGDVAAFAETDGSLDGILRLLMDKEGQRAAVLADANGIIVAAVGEAGLKEGMAATSQLVGSMCTQLVGMVPFSSIRSYALQDTQTNVIAGRAFMCQGETVGLVTYGPRSPGDRVLDGAMASLSAALE